MLTPPKTYYGFMSFFCNLLRVAVLRIMKFKHIKTDLKGGRSS